MLNSYYSSHLSHFIRSGSFCLALINLEMIFFVLVCLIVFKSLIKKNYKRDLHFILNSHVGYLASIYLF